MIVIINSLLACFVCSNLLKHLVKSNPYNVALKEVPFFSFVFLEGGGGGVGVLKNRAVLALSLLVLNRQLG